MRRKTGLMCLVVMLVLLGLIFVGGCAKKSIPQEYTPPENRGPTMYLTIKDSEYSDPNSYRVGLLLGKEYELQYSMKNTVYPGLISMKIDFPKEFKVTGDYTEWEGTTNSNTLIFKIIPQEKGFFEVVANTVWTNSSSGKMGITKTIDVYVDTDIKAIKNELDALKEKDNIVDVEPIKTVSG